MSLPGLQFNPAIAQFIRWSARGSCGQRGCTDEECRCAICDKPVGVAESDPRWLGHDPDCCGCELCADDVPPMLFRGEGKQMEQAQFHMACFLKLLAPATPEAQRTGTTAELRIRHRWIPLSRCELMLDPEGRVQIRQPDIDHGRVYCVCMGCHQHTYIETKWVGFYLGAPRPRALIQVP